MMTMTAEASANSLDFVQPGDPNPTPIDEIPLDGCTFTWAVRESVGAPFIVCCTRGAGHDGKQHVAEGAEEGVLAVHPWKK